MDPETDFAWYPYGAAGLDNYSNRVMVSKTLAEENPEAVTDLVRAINKAMSEVIADPAARVAVVNVFEPQTNEELELKRLEFALDNLIYSDEGRANRIGAIDMDRLDRSIGIIEKIYELPKAATTRDRLLRRLPSAARRPDVLTPTAARAQLGPPPGPNGAALTTQTLIAENALLGPDYEPSGPIRITIKDGKIAAIEPHSGDTPRLLAMPALADAHNHARPLSTTSFGAGLKPLETWLPQLATMPPVDPYLATAASLARSATGGAAGVMVHVTRFMGLTDRITEAREIARAAADVGVSIALAIGMRDRNPLIYGDEVGMLMGLQPEDHAIAEATWLGPMPEPADQIATVGAIAEALADQPHVDVQFGPNGVQWCSDDLLQSIADTSAATGRRVHMHLLETRPQRAWADMEYPNGIVPMLADIGLLSPRLTLAHCVWANEAEIAAIAASGARVAVNPSSNLHLSSGISPARAMLAAGIPVAMGLDGCALDEDDDALRELRLFRLLNAGWGFDEGIDPPAALLAACATGRAALGLPEGGILAPGLPADLLLLDLAALDRDGLMPVDPRAYLFTRATARHITAVYHNGRQIAANGTPTGVDLAALHDDLRAAYRAGLPSRAELIEAWPRIEQEIADHYYGCC